MKKKPAPKSARAAAKAKATTKVVKTKVVKTKVVKTKVAKMKAVASTKAEPKVERTTPSITQPVVRIEREREIALSEADWRWATWRKTGRAVEASAPTSEGFDREAVLARISTKVVPTKKGEEWDFANAELSPSMSADEARLWLECMLGIQRSVSPEKKAAELAKKKLTPVTLATVGRRLGESSYDPAPELALVLARLFSASEVTELFLEAKPLSDGTTAGGNFFHGYRTYVFPRLEEGEKEALSKRIAKEIAIENYATDRSGAPSHYGTGFADFALDHFKEPSPSFFLAALLGMHTELRAVVEQIPDLTYRGEGKPDGYNVPQVLIFGLESPELVTKHIERLKLSLAHPHWFRAWLAHHEHTHLEPLMQAVLATKNKERAAELADVLALVRAPENVGPMLTLALQSKAPAVAERWLAENVGHAATGCLAIVAEGGALATSAAARLRRYRELGHGALIDTIAKELEASGRSVDLAIAEVDHVVEELEAFPPALDKPFSLARKLEKKLPSWVSTDALPAIEIDGKRLSPDHMRTLLRALEDSTERAHPFVAALRDRATARSRDAFAWALFEQWLLAGGQPKDKWAFFALGYLGGDAAALKLAPLVREWPGKSLHQRAVIGIDVLGEIGTDAALVQISGLARTLYFPALKDHAEAVMAKFAKQRELSRDELEDVIVPHTGFDATGRRAFVYGARTYEVVLGAEARPMLRDVAGGPRIDELPEPLPGEDVVAAKRLRVDWMTLRKTLEETFKVQADRLEQMMVKGRRWTHEAFTRLVAHPLLGHLARTLVWGMYASNKKGALRTTFRVAEDGTFANLEDEAIARDEVDDLVGIVHPLDLDEATRARWGSLLADYEILPPFAQLSRPIRALLETDKENLGERFAGKTFSTSELFDALRERGWAHGDAGYGVVVAHQKRFPGLGVTAFVRHNAHWFRESTTADQPQEIHEVFFLRGLPATSKVNEYNWWQNTNGKIALREVDPRAISEVLYDLSI